MAYVTDGAIGINLDSPGSASGATLGEMHEGNGGSEWMYVLATEALVRGDAVQIDGSYNATQLLSNETTIGARIGFAQTAFAVSQFGFVALRGTGLAIKITGGATTVGVPLYTSDTAGALSASTASTSMFQVWGVYLTATVSGTTASAGTGFASFPMVRRPA